MEKKFVDILLGATASFDDILFEYHGNDGNAVAIAYSNVTCKLHA